MLDAPTVLLVRGDRAPDGLERLLEERCVYTEDSALEDLGPTAVAAVPDLIVAFGHEDVASVIAAVGEMERSVPVVVVCERRQHRDIESKEGERVAVLVPAEISEAGLALRLAALAKKAAEGKPLRVAPVPRPATSPRREERRPAGSAVVAPLRIPTPAPTAVPRPPVGAGASGLQPPPSIVPRIVIPAVPAKERDSAVPAPPVPPPPLEATPPGSVPPPPVAMTGRGSVPPPPVAMTGHGSVPPPPVAMTGHGSVPPPPPSLRREPSRQRTLVGVPRFPSPPPPAADSKADPSPAALVEESRPTIVDVAPGTRVVLIDDDVSRAGAIALALRESGIEVTTVSPDHSNVRWPVLRRFAPHAVLVDERALAKGMRQVVGAMRRDPFLKYVPLLPARFDRLYSESSGNADLSRLQPQLAPLGQREARWLEQTKDEPTTVVELSQVPLTRVVDALTSSGGAWTLTASASRGKLHWEIVDGRVGGASLDSANESEASELEAEAALRWLLFSDVPEVSVSRLPSPSGSDAELADEFLERMCTSVDAPTEFSRVPTATAGSEPAIPTAPRVPAVSAKAPTASAVDASSETTLVGTVLEHSAVLMRSAALRGGGLRRRAGSALRAMARGPGPKNLVRRARALQRRARTALGPVGAWIHERTGLAPVLQAQIALGLLLFSGAFLLVSTGTGASSSGDDEATVAVLATTPKTSPEPRAEPERDPEPATPQNEVKAPSKKQGSQLGLWRVSEDANVPTCSKWQSDASEPASHAEGYWRAARQALMQGKTDEAQQLMCHSVVLDPGGPASLGLAEFYLARRAVGEAAKLLDRLLASKPQHRVALELLGDVRSQQGRDEEALAIWLTTMGLSPGETSKRQLVARSLYHDGRKALSGDRPRAERLLRRAATLDPANHVVAGKLAVLFFKDGLVSAAASWAKRAISVEHYNGDARMVLGDIAREKKDFSTAQVEYRQIPTGDPNYPRALRWLESMPAE